MAFLENQEEKNLELQRFLAFLLGNTGSILRLN